MAYNFDDSPAHSPPMPSISEDLRFDLDRLVVSGNRVFGWGWVAHRERSIREVHLQIDAGGWKKRLATSFGLAREDVARAYPGFAAAARSGFVVTGYVPDASVGKVSLEVTFEDGGTRVIECGSVAEMRAGKRPVPKLQRLLRSAWRGLKMRDLSGLRRLRDRSGFGVASIEDARGVENLAQGLREAQAVRVIFDHDMGGGANHYRRKLVAGWLAAGDTALLCTYHLATLDYRLRVFAPGRREEEFRASSFLTLEGLLGKIPLAELFVNSPVSFDDPLMLADWLARMRAAHPGARLTVSAHDYFAVCPSFVLLNAEGRFCGIPDIAECGRCLAKHEGAHVALSPPAQIVPWRAAWQGCLQAADEIRCFSESTRQLMLRAYPALERRKLTLVPHERDYFPARLPRVDHGSPLVIGVVGTISCQKGASIVTGMLQILSTSQRDARIVVLGTLDAGGSSRQLSVTGPYSREDLPALVEQHGINMFLFPSVWPETYSFVVDEMMTLGMPIVAFDLGAPAERLRDYPLGRLCSTVAAEAALDAATRFHHELAAQASVAA